MTEVETIITAIMAVVGIICYAAYKLSGESWNYINWRYLCYLLVTALDK